MSLDIRPILFKLNSQIANRTSNCKSFKVKLEISSIQKNLALQFFSIFYAKELMKITQDILKAVVKVMTSSGGIGTGFLVSQKTTTNGEAKRRFFLITNKHMLGDWNLADGSILKYYRSIDVFFYRKNDPSGLSFKHSRINLKDSSGKLKTSKILIHPNPTIDIALVALFEELSPGKNIDLCSFDRSYLLNFNKITSWFIGLGDQVFAMGYPLGITSLKNNYPIAKAGYIASVPGEEFSIDCPVENRQHEKRTARVQGKILLVDGLLVPGNSGGPVILASELKVRLDPKKGTFQTASEETKNFVIGIISSALEPSGLTIVYSSDYIQELVDLYINNNATS